MEPVTNRCLVSVYYVIITHLTTLLFVLLKNIISSVVIFVISDCYFFRMKNMNMRNTW